MTKRKVFYTEMEHRSRLMREGASAIMNAQPIQPPLNIIKVGQTVFLKQKITDGPSDYSPGGIYGRRGDAVVVINVRAYQYPGLKPGADTKRGYCEVNWKYAVRHPFIKDDRGFLVTRNEIMPTDPILTHADKVMYLSESSRFKTLEDRFKE